MMAGNENIDFEDNAGSASRRRVDFYFETMVNNVDPDLSIKLAAEIAIIIAVSNWAYLKKANMVKSKIWRYLPDYFLELQKEHAEHTNSLEHFLGNTQFLIFEKGPPCRSVISCGFGRSIVERDLPVKPWSKNYNGPFATQDTYGAR